MLHNYISMHVVIIVDVKIYLFIAIVIVLYFKETNHRDILTQFQQPIYLSREGYDLFPLELKTMWIKTYLVT